MIIIDEFNDYSFYYVCGTCNVSGTMNIQEQVSDNCVLAVDLQCPHCGDNDVVYYTKCSDADIAKELLIKLEVLKNGRRKNESD